MAVRAPPDDWLLVDGCAASRTPYGPQLVTHYGIRPKLVILTHPHLDHSRGVAQVLEHATQGAKKDWPKIGLLFPSPRRGTSLDDLQHYFDAGVTEQAVATILQRWQTHPPCRWLLETESTETLGEATIRVLSPEEAARQDAFAAWEGKTAHFDWNRAASALLIEWRGHSILLGSDLVEKPGNGWSEALKRTPALAKHAIYKVAHHGSWDAQHRGVLKGAKGRKSMFIATPFASQNLPRFNTGEGMHLLLQHASAVHLTALPRGYGEQAGTPQRLTRAQLARRSNDLEFDPPAPGFPDCYVTLSFPPEAGPPRIAHGPGSVEVVARTTPPKRPARKKSSTRTVRSKGRSPKR
ncbi:MBL fold metallo-hydrolase [Cystobacter ferrugineus]|uniref:MBL fold metallo-hydrolase n=1 Tax=Cystobacter ferrugineus TaxID=83449 RepID=UPI000B01E95A|nr:MBL fold metallo-hydrolase [Cystobacter ferrugineus]